MGKIEDCHFDHFTSFRPQEEIFYENRRFVETCNACTECCPSLIGLNPLWCELDFASGIDKRQCDVPRRQEFGVSIDLMLIFDFYPRNPFEGRFDRQQIIVLCRLMVRTFRFDHHRKDTGCFHFPIGIATTPKKFGTCNFKERKIISVVNHSHLVGFHVSDTKLRFTGSMIMFEHVNSVKNGND